MDKPQENLTQYMELALDLAQAAGERDEIPVGAVLVDPSGNILGTGFNQREETKRTTAHAEIIALEDYNNRFKNWRLPEGTTLYVTVEPCLMCTGAMLWARLDNIHYGCRDTREAGLERIGALIEHGVFDHRFKKIEVGGLMEESCSSLMSDYFRAKRDSKKKA